jgi:hypothetical protein
MYTGVIDSSISAVVLIPKSIWWSLKMEAYRKVEPGHRSKAQTDRPWPPRPMPTGIRATDVSNQMTARQDSPAPQSPRAQGVHSRVLAP